MATYSTTYFRKVGLYLGYPRCCIEDFIDHSVCGLGHLRDKRPLYGTGFVPCASCAAKINETTPEQWVAENITPYRLETIPFPEHDRETMFRVLGYE